MLLGGRWAGARGFSGAHVTGPHVHLLLGPGLYPGQGPAAQEGGSSRLSSDVGPGQHQGRAQLSLVTECISFVLSLPQLLSHSLSSAECPFPGILPPETSSFLLFSASHGLESLFVGPQSGCFLGFLYCFCWSTSLCDFLKRVVSPWLPESVFALSSHWVAAPSGALLVSNSCFVIVTCIQSLKRSLCQQLDFPPWISSHPLFICGFLTSDVDGFGVGFCVYWCSVGPFTGRQALFFCLFTFFPFHFFCFLP